MRMSTAKVMLIVGLIAQLLAIPLLSAHITPILLVRVTSIVLLYSAALAYNNLYPEAIGAGLSVYSGLFTVTTVTQGMEILLYLVGALIMLS
jgi:NADH-ubiquinone oxidoreductase chain 2